MSKFRFEGLLRLREAERDEKRGLFLVAQRLVRETRERIEELERELAANGEETRQRRARGTLDSFESRRLKTFRDALSTRKKEMERVLRELERDETTKRTELDEAISEVKKLQTLKEKTEERRLEADKRRSVKEMDELATNKKAAERQKASRERERD